MAQINPHINFNGNAEEAFLFYQSVFGGEFTQIIRFKDLGPEFEVSASEVDKIMHIGLPIGRSILMANDVPERMGKVNENEHRSKIAVTTESVAEADTMFRALSKDGTVEIPGDATNDKQYFAMFRDKYGIEWMISFDSSAV